MNVFIFFLQNSVFPFRIQRSDCVQFDIDSKFTMEKNVPPQSKQRSSERKPHILRPSDDCKSNKYSCILECFSFSALSNKGVTFFLRISVHAKKWGVCVDGIFIATIVNRNMLMPKLRIADHPSSDIVILVCTYCSFFVKLRVIVSYGR